MIKYAFLLSFIFIAFGCSQDQSKNQTELHRNSNSKEILLVGTFHYNNPGADVAKTKDFDILSQKSQHELKDISLNIKHYNPTKIFVEWPYNQQKELDSLYQLYINNQYFTNDSLSDFYLKNEIFQLAFRVAKENKLESVHGIDYNETEFPFDEVMNDVVKNNQTELQTSIENGIAKITSDFDNKIDSGASLLELTYYLNSAEMRSFSNNFHTNLMLLAGDANDFSGSLLTSEWFKRNLYMWSLIQKLTEDSDDRIMLLVGASHAAIIELFIKENELWRVRELNEVIVP